MHICAKSINGFCWISDYAALPENLTCSLQFGGIYILRVYFDEFQCIYSAVSLDLADKIIYKI